MRKIKFRAWQESRKRMYRMGKDDYLEILSIFWDFVEKNNVIPMQFTGLRDKNGAEIYEGDIVLKPYQTRPYSQSSKEKRFPCVVEFHDGEFRYKRNDQSITYRCWNGGWDDTEVIGNVYENPDLLGGV
jgi:uncharacterized phage protein (TIGR01671 family)